jgi:signal transduction histidine kinase
VTAEVGDALIDVERFETALDCLIENAVKFTGPGDRIDVAGRRTSEGWTVEVRDTGAGMPTDVVGRLLSSPPGTVTSGGTGLGLAIVRTAVESRGGRVTIGSHRGEGTTVTLHMPPPVWEAVVL